MSDDAVLDAPDETEETDSLLLDGPIRELRRTFDLEDISVRAAGDGRTVEAYAAAFDQEVEIRDHEGHYFEVFKRGAFVRSIEAHQAGDSPIRVFFNHGKNLYGRELERFAMPLGQPLELREDGRGLRTVTRYARTDLADEVLELIRDGVVTHQSVTFTRPPGGGGFRRNRRNGSDLPLVERLNVRLIEYGPSLNKAYYPGAEVVGVRSLAEQIQQLSPTERAELIDALKQPSDGGDDEGRATGTPSRPTADEQMLLHEHELIAARNR